MFSGYKICFIYTYIYIYIYIFSEKLTGHALINMQAADEPDDLPEDVKKEIMKEVDS